MILDLEGRRAVVTGGSRGLGYGIAQALHDSGAEVIITGRTGKVWEAAAEIGSSGPPAYGVTGDLSSSGKRSVSRFWRFPMDVSISWLMRPEH